MLMGRRTYEGFAPVWPTRSQGQYRHGPSAIFALTDTTMLDNGSVILGKLFDWMTQPDLGGGPVDERGGALPPLEGKRKQSGYDRSAARCRVAEPQGSRRGPTGGGASR
jgi:hypothetical protein